jgi:hypothetical protein
LTLVYIHFSLLFIPEVTVALPESPP